MEYLNWNDIEYPKAYEQQLELVDQRIKGDIEDTIVFCNHPPLVTLGRGAKDTDIKGWEGSVFNSNRGGKATYHGPSQLVIYPIIKLKNNDVGKHLKSLEASVVKVLCNYNIKAMSSEDYTNYLNKNNLCENEITNEKEKLSYTGVWVGQQKIASIGIAVKKWVSYHGIAINLYKDPQAFTGINPCGFTNATMTSLEEILNKKIPQSQFIKAYKKNQFICL